MLWFWENEAKWLKLYCLDFILLYCLEFLKLWSFYGERNFYQRLLILLAEEPQENITFVYCNWNNVLKKSIMNITGSKLVRNFVESWVIAFFSSFSIFFFNSNCNVVYGATFYRAMYSKNSSILPRARFLGEKQTISRKN